MGVVREWHENGLLAKEEPYKNGVRDGIARQWNSKGELLGEYEMKLGRGVIREWNEADP